MKNKQVRTLVRKAVCVLASASMAALMVPAASLAGTQGANGDASAQTAALSTASTSAKPTLTVKRASTGKVTMKVGTKYKLKASASKGTLLYKSSKKKVVRVTKAGVLIAKKTGKAKVTVKIKGQSVARKIVVRVVKAKKYKKVKSIKLYRNVNEKNPYSSTYNAKTAAALGNSISLGAGSIFTICTKFNPSAASNKNLCYSSSKAGVATVSAAGVVTAKAAGTTKITVTPCDKPKAKKSFTFKVAASDLEVPQTAALECENDVASKAEVSTLCLSSDKELADSIDPDDIEFFGLLEGYKVAAVYRNDSYSLDVDIEKTSSSSKGSDTYGYVYMEPASFKDEVECGFGAVAFEEPEPTIEADSDLANYNASTNVLTLAVDLGAAQASDNLGKSSISLPADKEGVIKVKQVYVDSDDQSRVYIAFALPDNTYGEGFDKLDSLLTEGGIEIAANGTNCNDALIVTSEEVEAGDLYGYETTALDFLRPVVCGAVTSVDWEYCKDGSVAAHLSVDMEQYSYFADVNLRDGATVSAAVHWGNSDSSTWLFGCAGKSYLNSSSISLILTMEADDVEAYGVLNDDNTLDTELCDQLLNQNLSNQSVYLSGGIVKNDLGVIQSQQEVSLFRDDPLEDDSSLATASLKLMGEDDDESEQTKENWEKVRSYATQLLEAGGALAWGFINPDGHEWAYITGGIAGLLGFDTGEDSGVTNEEIMEQLEVMDTKLTSISTNVDKITTRLNEIEGRLSYNQTLTELRPLLHKTEIYASLVSNGVESIKDDSVDLAAEATTLNDKQIADSHQMAQATREKADRYGADAFKDTMALGEMLAGDSSLGAKSVVQTYADCVGTYYNWQPETCEAVSLFYARVACAYMSGYRAAYNELADELRNASDDTAKNKIAGYLNDLTNNHKKVTKTLVGELTKTTAGKYELKPENESSVCKLTHVDEDADSVLCTLDNKRYDKDAFRSQTFFDGDYDTAGFNFLSNDAEKVGNLEGSGFTAANWETMIDRMKNSTSYKSLYEELTAMGFDLGKPYLNQREKSDSYALRIQYTGQSSCYTRLLCGTATRSNPCGDKGVWQKYEWHGPVVDLTNNSVDNTSLVMSAEDRYYSYNIKFWKWHWGSKYSINTLWTTSV